MIKYLLNLIHPEVAAEAKTGAEVHQEATFGKLLEPKLRKVFYETYDEVPSEYSKFLKVNTSTKAQETDYGLGAMPIWQRFGNAAGGTFMAGTVPAATTGTNAMPGISYYTIPAGLERIYTHEEFAQGYAVERRFIDDEQYGVIEKMSADLARAGRYKVETDACSILNNAFTTNGYDGVPIISASHPLLNTAVVTTHGTGICSNLVEGALSDATLRAALLLGRKQVDEGGKLIQYNFDTLVVPPDLEMYANELVKSANKVESDYNNINPLQGRLKVVSLNFLTDSDAWFIMDSKRHSLNFFWRVKPEFKHEENFDTLVAKYRGYMRYSFGYSDFRGIIGSAGTAS